MLPMALVLCGFGLLTGTQDRGLVTARGPEMTDNGNYPGLDFDCARGREQGLSTSFSS